MEIIEINEGMVAELHRWAVESERLRMNFDLRTTPADGSQRMLNALEVGTQVPIHRHTDTSETTICLNGCLDIIFYDLCDGQYVETRRVRLCPGEGNYGIQIPQGAWHSVQVHEPSTIFEPKDGAYSPTTNASK